MNQVLIGDQSIARDLLLREDVAGTATMLQLTFELVLLSGLVNGNW